MIGIQNISPTMRRVREGGRSCRGWLNLSPKVRCMRVGGNLFISLLKTPIRVRWVSDWGRLGSECLNLKQLIVRWVRDCGR
jgi:hypothetical protein